MKSRSLFELKDVFESEAREMNTLADVFSGPTPTSAVLIRHLHNTAGKIGADADFLQQIDDERETDENSIRLTTQTTTPLQIVGPLAMYEGSKRIIGIMESLVEKTRDEITKRVISGETVTANLIGTMLNGLMERLTKWRKIREIISFIEGNDEGSLRLAGEMINAFVDSTNADSLAEELELFDKFRQ